MEASRPAAAEAGRAATARGLIRRSGHAALATLLDGRPYVSLVACACDLDAAPLLLLSDLAQHTRNLSAGAALSLLFEDPASPPDRLAGARLTVLGHAATPSAAKRELARFVARHPEAAVYAGFADFRLYRVTIERGHLVAGFGRISWIAAEELRFTGDCSELAAAEAAILARVNADPGLPAAIAARRLNRTESGWRATGIDPEGIDLTSGGDPIRVDFAAPALSPNEVQAALAALAGR